MRLPAHLTASGRAIRPGLPPAQVRALCPDRSAFVERHGAGPAVTRSELRALLSETRQRGHAVEDGEVTPGFASVAATVRDHSGHPVGAVAITYEDHLPRTGQLVDAVLHTARTLTQRLGGRVTSLVAAR